MLELLSKDEDVSFILTSGNDADRYATSDELYECMKEYVGENKIHKENLEDAIKNVMEGEEDKVNFIIGSFYVYGTVINKIKECKENKIDKLCKS